MKIAVSSSEFSSKLYYTLFVGDEESLFYLSIDKKFQREMNAFLGYMGHSFLVYILSYFKDRKPCVNLVVKTVVVEMDSVDSNVVILTKFRYNSKIEGSLQKNIRTEKRLCWN